MRSNENIVQRWLCIVISAMSFVPSFASNAREIALRRISGFCSTSFYEELVSNACAYVLVSQAAESDDIKYKSI
jgi:hypothetical protein